MNASEDSAAARLHMVQDRIADAAAIAGREAESVTLIAISKAWGPEHIIPMLDSGQRVFGENRIQEAQAKWPVLRAAYSGIQLHMVGQLQSNKAAEAVALFDCIHSVDRSSLIKALSREMAKQNRSIPCFLQVNIGEEAQKGGCAISEITALKVEAETAGVPIIGLMAVPPAGVEAAPYFALLAKLSREHGFTRISMGMSGDYETAIMLGATHVRVGSALFGARG